MRKPVLPAERQYISMDAAADEITTDLIERALDQKRDIGGWDIISHDTFRLAIKSSVSKRSLGADRGTAQARRGLERDGAFRPCPEPTRGGQPGKARAARLDVAWTYHHT